MAKKAIVLLGAGASKDAKLPDAYELTQQVYERLLETKSPDAQLYAVVVAKLIARNAKTGHSPFEPVNVEDVYDGLKRLINRDSDLLAEFASGWESIATSNEPAFDAQKFANALASMFEVTNRRSLTGAPYLQVDSGNIREATEAIQRAVTNDLEKYRGGSLAPFLETLSHILDTTGKDTKYFENFLQRFSGRFECIATLNYDRLLEVAAENSSIKVDHGLSQWNNKRYVKFHGKGLKLIKLHGSVDWYLRNDDEIHLEPGASVGPPTRAMIFGGQGDKLSPNGPFLHLRHEFQRFLRNSSYLLVVGYSFRDAHLNAMIRSWIATRRNGKLITVDPGGFQGDNGVFRYAAIRKGFNKIEKMRVEIDELKEGFANAMEPIEKALDSEPDLSPPIS